MINNDDPDWEYKYQNRIGKPFGSYGSVQPFGLKAIGLFNSQEEIDCSPRQTIGEYRVGDIKYQDMNGDGKIDGLDRIRPEKNQEPRFVAGLTLTAKWKGFDLMMLWQGATGAEVYIETWSGLDGNF